MVDERRNQIRWEPGEQTLPMRATERGSIVSGIFASLFGLAWVGALVASIVAGTLETGVRPAMTVLMLAFASPGLFILLFGLGQLFGRREVFLTRERVDVRERKVFRWRAWSEPVAAYAGVLKRVEHHAGSGAHQTSRTWYHVVLSHRDASRDVALFRSARLPQGWDEAWRRFTEMLSLPGLEETAEGVVETLPASGADASGTMEAPEAAAAEAPPAAPSLEELAAKLGQRVRLRRDGDAWELLYRHAHAAWKPALGVAVALGMLAFGWRLQARDPGSGIELFLWVMVGFAGIAALSFVRHLVASERLHLEPGRLVLRVWPARAGHAERAMPLVHVQRVLVKEDPRRPTLGRTVAIEGRGRTLRFGRGLPTATLQRVADLVRAHVEEHTDAPDAGAARVLRAPERVEIGASRAALRRRAGVVAAIGFGFVALAGVLMALAFGGEGRSPESKADPRANAERGASRSVRRPLDTPRNRILKAWHTHYQTAYEAAHDGRLDVAETRFRRALAEAEKLGPAGVDQRRSTLRYLAWVLERAGREDEAARFRTRAEAVPE